MFQAEPCTSTSEDSQRWKALGKVSGKLRGDIERHCSIPVDKNYSVTHPELLLVIRAQNNHAKPLP